MFGISAKKSTVTQHAVDNFHQHVLHIIPDIGICIDVLVVELWQ